MATLPEMGAALLSTTITVPVTSFSFPALSIARSFSSTFSPSANRAQLRMPRSSASFSVPPSASVCASPSSPVAVSVHVLSDRSATLPSTSTVPLTALPSVGERISSSGFVTSRNSESVSSRVLPTLSSKCRRIVCFPSEQSEISRRAVRSSSASRLICSPPSRLYQTGISPLCISLRPVQPKESSSEFVHEAGSIDVPATTGAVVSR